MSEWAQKRFWRAAEAAPAPDGWTVELDGRGLSTPARKPLIVPTKGLASAIAAEWDAQDEQVRPTAMPLTRAANSAIDKVLPRRADVAEMLLAYGETDLICYRADAPEGLVAAQEEAWDPLIEWARDALGAPMVATVGMIHVDQPKRARQALRAAVIGQDAFALTALHDLVTVSGSLVIGLAAQAGLRPADELWTLSRIDECWQEQQWGTDADAAKTAAAQREAFLSSAEFFRLSRPAAQ